MDELSWFLGTLRSKDYLPLSRLIPGFPRDLRTPNVLKTQVVGVLTRGFSNNGRRSKHLKMHIHELFKKSGADLIGKYPDLVSESVDDLILKMKAESRIRPYQQISMFYTMFEDQYIELLPKLLAAPNELSPLEALVDTEPVLNKLDKLVGRETFEDLIPVIQSDVLGIQDTKFCNDEDELLSELLKTKKKERYQLLFSFLITDERYKNPEYKRLCDAVIRDYHSKKYADLEKDFVQNKATIEGQARENQNLHARIRELELIEKEAAQLRQQLEVLMSQNEVATTAYQAANNELEQIKVKYDSASYWRDSIQRYMREIKPEDRHYLIVTDDPSSIVTTFFNIQGVARDALTSIGSKRLWDQRYKNTCFFVLRNNFISTDDWFQFVGLMNRFGAEYREVTGYEEMRHIAEIINFMLEEN
ncbi:hypothetical protein [Paenibacillus gansuensis]|uniref:Uncharacterized protein n=1 Tax=Paenibacillus gansuensis TaxID=306542 RepID=A0ABW5PEB9_9BACL